MNCQTRVEATLDWLDIVAELDQRQGHWAHGRQADGIRIVERLLECDLGLDKRAKLLGHLHRRLGQAGDRQKARVRRLEVLGELRLIREELPAHERAAATLALADALLVESGGDDAIPILRAALDEELPPGHHSEGLRAHLYFSLAKAHLAESNFDLAMDAIGSSIEAARRFGSLELIASMEWEGSLAIHRKMGIRYYRLPYLTRAREAAEQIPDPVRICEFGLEEARCAREPWEAVPALAAVKANLHLIRVEARRTHVEEAYHMYRNRHGLPDPIGLVPTPTQRMELGGPARESHIDDRSSLSERIEAYYGFVPVPASETPELTVGVLQDRFAASRRSGDIGAFASNGLALLDATRQLSTPARVDRVALSVIKDLDEVLALFEVIEPLMRGISMACIGIAERMMNGREFVDGEEAERISWWLIRSLASTQRRRLERGQRPDGVSVGAWEMWRESLRYGLPSMVYDALQQVRQESPSFLTGVFDPDPLAAELGEDGLLVGVIRLPDSPLDVLVGREVRTNHLAFLLDRSPEWRYRLVHLCPEKWPAFEQASTPSASELDARDRWVRDALVGPLKDVAGSWPDRVLWCPKGPSEVAAPSLLWPSATRLTMCSSPS